MALDLVETDSLIAKLISTTPASRLNRSEMRVVLSKLEELGYTIVPKPPGAVPAEVA